MSAAPGRKQTLTLAAVAAASAALTACGGGSGTSDGAGGETTAATAAATTASPVAVLASGARVDPTTITLALRLRQPRGVDPPIAKTATVTLQGKGINYDGSRQPTCDVATIKAHGADGCPTGSVLGTGLALGTADTARTTARITILNGPRDTVLLATVIRNPAYVKAVVPGRITASAGDDTTNAITIAFTFPRALQDVGGVPIGLQQLTLALARRPGGAITAAACDPATWRYDASVAFADHTTARHRGRATC